MNSKNILVLAYAISPHKGSEFSVAWNYVTTMSQSHHLTVLYGVSGDYMGETSELEEYILQHPMRNVDFVKIPPNRWALFFAMLDKIGMWFFTYAAFMLWNKTAFKVAKKILQTKHIDVIHFLGPIGYREPGYLWKLNKPHIWGPLEGTHIKPLVLYEALPLKYKIMFFVKDCINYIQLRTSFRVRQAAKNSDVVIAATTKTQERIEKIFLRKCEYIPENGIMQMMTDFPVSVAGRLNLVWIGRVDPGKSLIILLEALAKIPNNNWFLNVIGDGNQRKRCVSFANSHGINEKIKWHGQVSRENVIDLLKSMHLHVLTSLSEANTTVVFEALSFGIPTITLDHCGMRDTIDESCGIKIPIQSYQQVVDNFAKQIQFLSDNPKEIERLSQGALVRAKQYLLEIRKDYFEKMYDKAILCHMKSEVF